MLANDDASCYDDESVFADPVSPKPVSKRSRKPRVPSAPRKAPAKRKNAKDELSSYLPDGRPLPPRIVGPIDLNQPLLFNQDPRAAHVDRALIQPTAPAQLRDKVANVSQSLVQTNRFGIVGATDKNGQTAVATPLTAEFFAEPGVAEAYVKCYLRFKARCEARKEGDWVLEDFALAQGYAAAELAFRKACAAHDVPYRCDYLPVPILGPKNSPLSKAGAAALEPVTSDNNSTKGTTLRERVAPLEFWVGEQAVARAPVGPVDALANTFSQSIANKRQKNKHPVPAAAAQQGNEDEEEESLIASDVVAEQPQHQDEEVLEDADPALEDDDITSLLSMLGSQPGSKASPAERKDQELQHLLNNSSPATTSAARLERAPDTTVDTVAEAISEIRGNATMCNISALLADLCIDELPISGIWVIA